MPMNPASRSSATLAQGYSSVRSVSAAVGAKARCASSRARSWSSRCSGESGYMPSLVSAAPELQEVGGDVAGEQRLEAPRLEGAAVLRARGVVGVVHPALHRLLPGRAVGPLRVGHGDAVVAAVQPRAPAAELVGDRLGARAPA